MTHRDKVLSIIDKNYNLDDITKELILADDENQYDDNGVCLWWEVYGIDGGYYKVWGQDNELDNQCVKVHKRIRMEPVTYWDEL